MTKFAIWNFTIKRSISRLLQKLYRSLILFGKHIAPPTVVVVNISIKWRRPPMYFLYVISQLKCLYLDVVTNSFNSVSKKHSTPPTVVVLYINAMKKTFGVNFNFYQAFKQHGYTKKWKFEKQININDDYCNWFSNF